MESGQTAALSDQSPVCWTINPSDYRPVLLRTAHTMQTRQTTGLSATDRWTTDPLDKGFVGLQTSWTTNLSDYSPIRLQIHQLTALPDYRPVRLQTLRTTAQSDYESVKILWQTTLSDYDHRPVRLQTYSVKLLCQTTTADPSDCRPAGLQT